MENASKALLMAGATLIAILIITLFVLMNNQIKSYQQQKDEAEKAQQISKFNNDFERYLVMDDDGISGADVVTLINKLNEYNQKSKANTEDNTTDNGKAIDYNVVMTITISNMGNTDEKNGNTQGFRKRYGYDENTDGLFKGIMQNGKIIIESNNTKALNYTRFRKFQVQDKNALEIASTLYQKNYAIESDAKIQELIGEALYEYNSKKYTAKTAWKYGGELEKATIAEYTEYKEFVSSTFVKDGNTEYAKNGQIQKIYLKFYN